MTTTKTITVEQTGSATGRPERQRKTLIGLGLTRSAGAGPSRTRLPCAA